MSWIAFLVDCLNRYANLLLAIITAVYVYLTWKTLKALERSSLRDREAKHLADIKRQVVAPILQWLDFSVVETLRGRHDPAIIMTAPGYDPSLGARRQLFPAVLRMNDLSQDLYEHAQGEHFETLRKYQVFREIAEQLFGALAEFGNKCCIPIQKLTSLPPFDGDRSKNFVDCEGAVQFCLRTIVSGIEPRFYLTAENGVAVVTTAYSAEVIARGPEAEVQRWLDQTKKLIEDSWNDARLRERIQRTIDDAERLRDSIRQIELTHALSRACKYITD